MKRARPRQRVLDRARTSENGQGISNLSIHRRMLCGRCYLGLQVFVASSQISAGLQSAGPVGAGVDGEVCASTGSANVVRKPHSSAAEMNLGMVGFLRRFQLRQQRLRSCASSIALSGRLGAMPADWRVLAREADERAAGPKIIIAPAPPSRPYRRARSDVPTRP
jgi:hypothetical protein